MTQRSKRKKLFKEGNVLTYRTKYNFIYSYENAYTVRAREYAMFKDFAQYT